MEQCCKPDILHLMGTRTFHMLLQREGASQNLIEMLSSADGKVN